MGKLDDFRRSADWVQRARDLHDIRQEKLYKERFRTFEEWIRRECHIRRTSVFDHIKIVRALGHLPDETLRRMGLFNAKLLARVSEDGHSLENRLIEQAQKLDHRTFQAVLKKSFPGSGYSAELGQPINVPGMRYAPLNEQGLVYLFGLLSMKLGFEVEFVRREFPDCEATQQVPGSHIRKRVRIEFEYRSREFEAHRHDVAGCDLIVCWENDWGKNCPLPCVELSKEIERFSKERHA